MRDNSRKRQGEAARKKKKTMIKNIHKLGQFPGINIAFVIRQNGQYITYQSVVDFPPSRKQIISGSLDSIISQAKCTSDVFISYP